MSYLQFAPLRAFRAARVVAADPDQLPEVFTIIESLSVDTLQRIGRRMQESEMGRRLIEKRPDVVELLADRDALAKLPAGSLGRAYLAFVEREKISADGIREAAKAGMKHAGDIPAPLDWVHARMRDTHDLWHAVTGYSGDVLGEASLLAFTFAQTHNPGIAFIIAIAIAKTANAALGGGKEARKTMLDGFRRGRKAAWLPGQDWESMLALPIEEVRARLGIEAPAVYTEIRSSELKAAAA
ncbi:MAG TPA: Coq4 family protein [Polyangiaceae bacterium]|jgi:ubiquinone biosynthesis protein COQ4